MLLIISIILIAGGYYTFFSLDPDMPYEELLIKLRLSQISILVGSFLFLYKLYRKL